MKAMLLRTFGSPLELVDLPIPKPTAVQVLLKVQACAVCRTDLHVVDGDLKKPKLPIIPGHEIIGRITEVGKSVKNIKVGDRIGVPWLGQTCRECPFCKMDKENLCDHPLFTGYQIDGGYAEYTVANADYCFPVQGSYSDAEAAPLLCAGLIGYRSLRFADGAHNVGIYGFGAAAHIVTQVARYEGKNVFAFVRPGDEEARTFAQTLGCSWAGSSTDLPPISLDAAIIFAPVGDLVPFALRAVRKGGTVILAGIHMSQIPSMPYDILWGERVIRSVANLTRKDGVEFLSLAPKIPVKTHITTFPLTEANTALDALRRGEVSGAAVLIP